MINVQEELRVWRTITWPLIRDNFNWPFIKRAILWEYLSMVPPALQSWSLETELRQAMKEEEEKP